MTATWFRRATLALACVCATLLASCGSSTVESALAPSRFLAVGDAFSDLGQTSNGSVTNARYTVNDGSINIWSQQLAARYGLPLTTASLGGLSYAQAHARVVSSVDAVGGNAPSIQAQVSSLLTANVLGPNDVVLVEGGISDIIAEMATGSPSVANVKAAGTALGGEVRRLVAAGAKYVLVIGAYNLGQSRWAIETGQRDLLRALSTAFNDALEVSIVDLGANVLYVDAAYYFNLVTSSPSGYGLTSDTPYAPSTAITAAQVPVACTSVDPGVGIGTGTGQVNSALCTTGTLTAGIDYNTTLFADRVYMTPAGQRLLGNYAYDRLRKRW